MAGNYCLPKKYTQPFFDALSSGKLDRQKIRRMSSDARRAEFEKYMPKDHALTVNELFEEKLLLVDQEKGITNWTNQMLGNNSPAARDLVNKVVRNKKLLTPETEKQLLHDVAAKKFGADVSAAEANAIFDLAEQAKELEVIAKQDITNLKNRIAWGNKIQELDDLVSELSPDSRAWHNKVFDIVGIPKAVSSTGDLSAVGNQGWGMITTGPGVRGVPEMLKYFADEKALRDLNALILTDPDLPLMKSAKLGLTDLGKSLYKREDQFQSSMLDSATEFLFDKTGIPKLNPIAASTRAYVGYLNYVRYYRFKQLLGYARMAGEDIRIGSKATKDLAAAVNDFTGRSNLGVGDKWGNVAPLANAVLWAPRKMVSSFQMILGTPIKLLNPRISPTAKKAMLRQLVGSVAATGVIIGMAREAGATADFDPRSQKFGQICFGDSCIDLTGGNRTTVRLLVRIVLSMINHTKIWDEIPEVIDNQGNEEKLKPGTSYGSVGNEIWSFKRGKFAPVASFFTDLILQETAIGEPFDLKKQAQERLVPLGMGSIIDLANNDPENAAAWAMVPMSIFGAGLSSRPPKTKQGLTKWGTEPNSDTEEVEKELDEALKAISTKEEKVEWGFVPQTINGVKLTDDQYHDYLVMLGARVKEELYEVIHSPEWELAPVEERAAYVKNNIFRPARAQVLSQIINNSALDNDGQGNDIFEQSDISVRETNRPDR